MGYFLYNLGIVLDWLFLGPWTVAPSNVLLAIILISSAFIFRMLLLRSRLLVLSLIVSLAAATLHIGVIASVRAVSSLIGLGFISSGIAFYPIAFALLMIMTPVVEATRKKMKGASFSDW